MVAAVAGLDELYYGQLRWIVGLGGGCSQVEKTGMAHNSSIGRGSRHNGAPLPPTHVPSQTYALSASIPQTGNNRITIDPFCHIQKHYQTKQMRICPRPKDTQKLLTRTRAHCQARKRKIAFVVQLAQIFRLLTIRLKMNKITVPGLYFSLGQYYQI